LVRTALQQRGLDNLLPPVKGRQVALEAKVGVLGGHILEGGEEGLHRDFIWHFDSMSFRNLFLYQNPTDVRSVTGGSFLLLSLRRWFQLDV